MNRVENRMRFSGPGDFSSEWEEEGSIGPPFESGQDDSLSAVL